MNRNRIKRLAAGVLALSMVCSLRVQAQAATTVSKECKRAAALVDQVAKEDKNTLMSPLSLDMALAMAGNGAVGVTKKELESYLGTTIGAYNKFAAANYAKDAEELKVANSIWVTTKKGFQLNSKFASKLEKNYQAKSSRVDFTDQATIKTINQWVKEHTGNMIPKILDSTSKKTRMMLVNALYFDSEWRDKFSGSATAKDTFTNSNGKKASVSFMNGDAEYYYKNSKATGFGKQYKNSRYEFIAVLPKKSGSFQLSDLNLASLIKSKNADMHVHVQMPKFTYDDSAEDELKAALQQLGVTNSFSDYARFDNMLTKDTDKKLKIDRVIQKTKIVVDEDGTKAAAATVVDMVETTAIDTREHVNVILNRPFAFLIYDNEAQAILFAGKVNTLK